MTRLTLIAALGRNRVIGRDGDMPWHLPEDLRHFKAATLGHPLIMGRATFDSIGRPLPGRRTIVVTRNHEWSHEGVEVAHSLDDALGLAADANEVFVAGGGQIYAQALARADRLLLTLVDAEPAGDTYFPPWSAKEWVEVARDPRQGFAFVTFERRPSGV